MLPAVFADLATEEKIKPKPMELREVKTIIGTVRWSGPKKRGNARDITRRMWVSCNLQVSRV